MDMERTKKEGKRMEIREKYMGIFASMHERYIYIGVLHLR